MLNWLIFPVPTPMSELNDIAFCPTLGKWIAVGSSLGNGVALQSEDGLSWTVLTTGFEASGPFVGVRGTDAATVRGHIVIVGSPGIIEMQQNETWTDVTPALFGLSPSANCPIAYLGGIGFCVVGLSLGSPVGWVSTDGVTWQAGGITNGEQRIRTRIGIDFVRFDYGAAGIARGDGVDWTDLSPGFVIFDIVRNSSDGFTYAITNHASSQRAIRKSSGNLTSWEIIATFNNNELFDIILYDFSGNQLVLLGFESCKISDDFVIWEEVGYPPELTQTMAGSASAPYVVCGDDDYLLVGAGLDFNLETDGGYDPDFPGITPPENPNGDFNESTNEIILTFDTDNPAPEKVDGYIIYRDSSFVGSVANDELANTKTFTDEVPVGTATYTYTIQAYNSEDRKLSVSVTVQVVAAVPDINIVGSGQIDLGGAATIMMLARPSGLYTLVAGKTHDTLYERSGSIDTVDVAIPEPFVTLGYFGDD